jgi:hypothetical protein
MAKVITHRHHKYYPLRPKNPLTENYHQPNNEITIQHLLVTEMDTQASCINIITSDISYSNPSVYELNSVLRNCS